MRPGCRFRFRRRISKIGRTKIIPLHGWPHSAKVPSTPAAATTFQRGRSAPYVTQDFFNVIGVSPQSGRAFEAREQEFRASGTAVLGEGLWRRQYGADPKILGRKVKLMGQPFTVTGVMPPGFDYPDRSEVWIAAGAFFNIPSRTAHNFRVVGRLRPGVSIEPAQATLAPSTGG
jgi:hypothetical protein